MQDLSRDQTKLILASSQLTLIFVHSPFCGTCHIARKMLLTIEAVYEKEIFKEMNASLHPSLMESYQIKSVPCLLVTKNGQVVDRVYAFHSVPFMFEKVSNYVK